MPGRPRKRTLLVVTAATALGLAAVASLALVLHRLDGRGNPWTTTTVSFTDGTTVEFQHQQAHPYLAEHRMRAIVTRGDGISTHLDLGHDPGSSFPVQLALCTNETSRYLHIRTFEDYVLDLDSLSRVMHEPGKFDLSIDNKAALPPATETASISTSGEFSRAQTPSPQP